jgi:predicted MFS family arabinose efflux permease
MNNNEEVNMSRAIKIFILLCLAYIISQFHRSALAVISTDVSAEFGLSVSELGVVTAAFFLSFMAFQIPCGMMLDRLGARKTLAILLVINAIGSLGFALSTGYFSLSMSRVLLGIGNAALLIGTLVVVAKLFPPEKFAKLSGILLAVGTLGNVLSTFPMGWVQESVGWRYAFFAFTFIPLVFAWLVMKMVPDDAGALKRETLSEMMAGFKQVFSIKDFWKLFFVQLVWYAGTMSLFALWGRPLLKEFHGLDAVDSGLILTLFPVLSIVSYIVMGDFDQRFNTRKKLVIAGIGSNATAFLLLALYPTMPLWAFAACISTIGMAAGCFPFLLAHGRSNFPSAILGRGIAALNLANMGGVGMMQVVTGYMFEGLTAKGYASPFVYSTIFGLIAACLWCAIAFYLFAEDKKPR